MSTVSLIMWFLRLYGLAVKDMPVVGYEHLSLLQSHVTCMLSDECLNRIPGLLNVNVCIQRPWRMSRKGIPRQTKRKRSMAEHKKPLVRSSWAENSETYGRNTSVGCRTGEAGTSTSSWKRQCVQRDGDVIRRLGVCVLVSVIMARLLAGCRPYSRLANVTCSHSVRDAPYGAACIDRLTSRRSERRCYHLHGRTATCFSCTE